MVHTWKRELLERAGELFSRAKRRARLARFTASRSSDASRPQGAVSVIKALRTTLSARRSIRPPFAERGNYRLQRPKPAIKNPEIAEIFEPAVARIEAVAASFRRGAVEHQLVSPQGPWPAPRFRFPAVSGKNPENPAARAAAR